MLSSLICRTLLQIARLPLTLTSLVVPPVAHLAPKSRCSATGDKLARYGMAPDDIMWAAIITNLIGAGLN
jgi:hypothetical protein